MRRVVIALGWVAVAAWLVAAPARLAAQPNAADADRLAALINEVRRARGLPLLARSPALDADALVHSRKLAARRDLFHSSRRELDRLGVDWIRVAENVATAADADEAHSATMESRVHRENILGRYELVGVGVIRDARGRVWVTELFAALDASR